MQQAEDWAHRLNQKQCVNVYYLFGAKTIDEVVYPLITSKSNVTAAALDNSKSDYNLVKKR